MQDPRDISITDFDYPLPDEKIARYPLPQRDQSRLLVWKKGLISDAPFGDLPGLLPAGCFLVFNQSSVIKARLLFTNDRNARIEIFCLEPETEVSQALQAHGTVLWRCLVGRLKKWKDETLTLRSGRVTLQATVAEKRSEDVLVRFNWEPAELTFAEVLTEAGALPIPPYLDRKAEAIDDTRYQTVYASEEGSVAAPTAGLHFTTELMSRLERSNIRSLKLSLHVGSGTFKPVKATKLGGHKMHAEWLVAGRPVIQALVSAGETPIVAVGTTSLRAMESLYWLGVKILEEGLRPGFVHEVGQWDPYGPHNGISRTGALQALLGAMDQRKLDVVSCRTSLLLAPPYEMRVASGLITNFHQPKSTLLLLVAAFAGKDWAEIYRHALENDYRFLSYGDSSLLLR